MYQNVGDWTAEFYPPPYDFMAPPQTGWASGHTHDCGGCGGGCGCASCKGLGLFDSGLDVTQWGAAEWAVAALGVYLAMNILGDVSGGVKRVKRFSTRRRRRKAAIKRLREA